MRKRVFTSIAALGALTTAAWAGERVTLQNGYEMRCDHHAEVQGRVRLYLSAGADNYIEFVPQEIAGVEQVADPVPTELAPVIVNSPARETLASSPAAQANLSPADLHEMLAKAGGEHNLDVDLLASLVKAESGGNVRAVSRTGARGLMQLMPGTASALGVQDSFKPDQNVRGGSTYLDTLLTRYHDNLALALAAYNAGPGAVDKYRGIPPYSETRAYVAHVIHEFNRRVLAREALAKQAIASAAMPVSNGTR
jgi:soluble lytic murein transglycosylase-like protein